MKHCFYLFLSGVKLFVKMKSKIKTSNKQIIRHTLSVPLHSAETPSLSRWSLYSYKITLFASFDLVFSPLALLGHNTQHLTLFILLLLKVLMTYILTALNNSKPNQTAFQSEMHLLLLGLFIYLLFYTCGVALALTAALLLWEKVE